MQTSSGSKLGQFLALAAFLWITPLGAMGASGDPIEEIIVTATKREASLQKVPMSISALQEETLLDAGMNQVTSLSTLVAGLDANNQGPGESSIAIRGIPDMTGDFFVNPTVGLYVDEIPMVGHPARSPELSLYDAERVEVLRGPQGTLFGDGSLGGTIRVITNKPDTERLSGGMLGTLSSWDGGGENLAMKGFVNVPLIEEKLAVRLTGSFRDDGGYIDNELPGTLVEDTSNTNSYESSHLRAALRAHPTETLTLDFVYSWSDLDVQDITEEQFPGVKNRNILEPNTNEMNLAGLTVTWDSSWATLVSATAYTTIDQTNSYEISDFVVPLIPTLQFFFPAELGGLTVSAANFDFVNEQETFTQELRLVSPGSSDFNWTVGAFYRNDKRDQYEDIFTFPDDIGAGMGAPTLDFTFEQEFDQWAVFGEFDYQMGDFNVLLGGRYYEEDKSSSTATLGWITFAPPLISQSDDDADTFIPKVVVSYIPDNTLTTYVSYTEGFRAGGVNALSEAALAFGATLPSGFGPEDLSAWEIGVKKSWLSGSLQTNLYVYRNTWEDMIQSFIDADTNFGYEGNAGEAESQGFEFELVATPIDRLNLIFGAAYIDTEFKEDVFDATTGDQLVVEGNRIPGIPEWSYSLSADYSVPIGALQGFARADFYHRDTTYSEPSNSDISKTDKLDILNLRVGVRQERWSAYLFANNVTNEDGAVLAFPPLTPSINAVDATFVAPREVGLDLRVHF